MLAGLKCVIIQKELTRIRGWLFRFYKGTIWYKVSIRDYNIPHGNTNSRVIGHTALLKAVPNRPVFHP